MGASTVARAASGTPRTSARYRRSTSCAARSATTTVVRVRRAGHDEETARVAVEAVHDPRPAGVADVGQVGVAGEETLDEGAVLVPGSRVDHEPRRLVHDDDVVVGGAHVDRDVLADRHPVGLRLGEQLHGRAGTEAVALGGDLAVDADRARRDEGLHLDTAPAGQERDGPVDALPDERGGDGKRVWLLGHHASGGVGAPTATIEPGLTARGRPGRLPHPCAPAHGAPRHLTRPRVGLVLASRGVVGHGPLSGAGQFVVKGRREVADSRGTDLRSLERRDTRQQSRGLPCHPGVGQPPSSSQSRSPC